MASEIQANAENRIFFFLYFDLHWCGTIGVFETQTKVPPAHCYSALAIFVSSLILWLAESIPNYLTSFLIIVAAVLTGVMKMRPAFAMLGEPVMILNIASFIMASALVVTGLAKRICIYMVLRMGGNLGMMLLCFIGLNLLLGAFISATSAKTALLLPLFMYAMFGMTEAARTTQTGRGNVAAAMVVMMTTYGVILVGGSLGATLSVERTTGISRMYALTPIQPWVILLVRLTALVALSAFIALICFSVGLATGSQMTAGAWAASAAVVIALSALGALIGLACGYTIKGENAYSASAFVMVFGAFVSGMFIPLEQMPPFVSHVAPFTPLYGAVQAIYAVAGTVPMPTAAWLNIVGWVVITAGIAWWGASHDTAR